jgi:anhydro-N-acetylmuramic acid kinase
MNLKPLKILGVMSGTSCDGLDLALCSFSCVNGIWSFRLINAETLEYSAEMRQQLIRSIYLEASQLVKLDHFFGKWIGETCSRFLKKNGENADLIASHGHTVFHNPAESCTLQIGNGFNIAATSGIPVIYDFRSMDIANGGQGAPLVPIGDELLFGKYKACLNLGGFSNISYRLDNLRIAYDICPVNIVINHLANQLNYEFDRDGEIGRKGRIIPDLLAQLESIPYYHSSPPKSLSKEWVVDHFLPLLEIKTDVPDLLRTVYEHITNRISSATENFSSSEVLTTGGGAHNLFLIELLGSKSKCTYILPKKNLIDFKEAIIFAFLGYLRYHGINNALKSVTGAKKDSCGGLLVNP